MKKRREKRGGHKKKRGEYGLRHEEKRGGKGTE